MKEVESIRKYQMSASELKEIEDSVIAYGVYQVIDGRIVPLALSGGFIDMFGVPKEQLYSILSEDVFRITHPDDLARYKNDTFAFVMNPDAEYNTSCRIKLPTDDYYVILRAQGKHRILQDGTDLCIVWYTRSALPADDIALRNNELERREMEELRKENRNIRKMYYDVLTGLPNMFLFLQLARMAFKELDDENGYYTIMAFDFSGMKHYNSKYGLEKGDRLLRSFAGIMRNHFGSDCCSRFGEDHFYAFSFKDDVEEELESIFEETKNINNSNSLPLKAGVYKHAKKDMPVSLICDKAKIAVDMLKDSYESKYLIFDENMEKDMNIRNHILSHLDQALNERWIQVYYQPIIRAVNSRMCGEEALARWVDPELGIIMPEDFIPIIEDVRLLSKVDLYMVERILEDMIDARIKNKVPMSPVSVNISRYDFEYCDMVTEITQRVKAAEISPKYLNIEITENVSGIETDFLKEQVRRFHENGFKVWMDDFGSGYSNLNVLQDFDFDLIKLDIKFMMNFGKSKKSKGIIIKIIEMAEQLGVDTLAEGVETEEQLKFLKEIGCDKVQGLLYSSPNPIEEIILRYRLGVGLQREKMEEADYYDKIGQASLDDPNFNSDTATKIAQHFTGIGVGIMEYIGDDKYRILRVNKSYRNYLKIMYGPDVKFEGIIGYSDMERHHVFKDSVERCIVSGNWEAAYDIISVKDIKINTNTKVLARDPLTGAYALMIVMTSEKRNKNDTKGYEDISPVSFGSDFVIPAIDTKTRLQRHTVDDAIIKIVEHLNAENPYNDSIRKVLKEISAVIHPEKIYILEKDGEHISSIFKCEDGDISLSTDHLRNRDYDFYSHIWDKYLGTVVDGISAETADIKEFDKELYYDLKKYDINRLTLAPVFSKGVIIGFVGADDYRLDEKEDTEYILSTVAGFLSFRMANNILVERLIYVAEHDELTSSFNRNALMKREVELSKTTGSVGIVFADVNGLKYANDNFGHDEGDRLLIRAADLIAKHYERNHLYRVGGDEFVVVIPGIAKAAFDRKQYRFLRDLKTRDNISMATGFVWEPDVRNLSGALKEADKRMYVDKAKYYAHHDRRKRAR